MNLRSRREESVDHRMDHKSCLMDGVIINEVGLRDGLQNQPRFVSTAGKLQILDALLAAGIKNFELASFVSPKVVPQMRDAEDVVLGAPRSGAVIYTSLIPNERGYERAVAAGVRSVSLVVGATESMNRRNINMSLDDALSTASRVISRARKDGIRTQVYIAVAFVCPYEGKVSASTTIDHANCLLDQGADEIIIADTIGFADPRSVSDLFDKLGTRFELSRFSAHFHDTQGLALANCWSASRCWITKFDASIGGLGGCPFAPGAAGNVATEDLVHMFDSSNIHTGIDLERLVAAVGIAEEIIGAQLGGRWLQWRRSRKIEEKESMPTLSQNVAS